MLIRCRLIPAHAGSTKLPMNSRNTRRAHPRSRGEHIRCGGTKNLTEGSSPLTRGARTILSPRGMVCGLIPAHAGSTEHNGRKNAWPTAHPRSRGEHAVGMQEKHLERGSSPLTRGALVHASATGYAVGLIPAHAGSTTVATVPRHADRGSSPLTRGAPWHDHQRINRPGLIPAHAGSTSR